MTEEEERAELKLIATLKDRAYTLGELHCVKVHLAMASKVTDKAAVCDAILARASSIINNLISICEK